MIKVVIGIIVAIIIIVAILLNACMLLSINHVKCPKCGEDMEFWGNAVMADKDNIWYLKNFRYNYKHFGYTHVYKCPHCGATKII